MASGILLEHIEKRRNVTGNWWGWGKREVWKADVRNLNIYSKIYLECSFKPHDFLGSGETSDNMHELTDMNLLNGSWKAPQEKNLNVVKMLFVLYNKFSIDLKKLVKSIFSVLL